MSDAPLTSPRSASSYHSDDESYNQMLQISKENKYLLKQLLLTLTSNSITNVTLQKHGPLDPGASPISHPSTNSTFYNENDMSMDPITETQQNIRVSTKKVREPASSALQRKQSFYQIYPASTRQLTEYYCYLQQSYG